eukprot:COSAG02_NODE_1829_length_10738_cov_4.595827_9_plen_135_part_00
MPRPPAGPTVSLKPLPSKPGAHAPCLLQVIDVLHPGRANVPHAEIQKELAEKYRAKGNCVFTFGMKTAFGGGKSTGFGLVYDNEAKAMAMEARYRLVRNGLKEAKPGGMKSKKEKKNRMKKLRGIAKAGGAAAK